MKKMHKNLIYLEIFGGADMPKQGAVVQKPAVHNDRGTN